jgi:hypothetical protein
MPDDIVQGIVDMHSAGLHTTGQVADHFNVSTRMVQKLATRAGVIRTAKQSWWLSRTNGRWDYRRSLPAEKKVRKPISPRLHHAIISGHPYCALCGNQASETIRLEVDHIDKNPSNSDRPNL